MYNFRQLNEGEKKAKSIFHQCFKRFVGTSPGVKLFCITLGGLVANLLGAVAVPPSVYNKHECHSRLSSKAIPPKCPPRCRAGLAKLAVYHQEEELHTNDTQ